MRLGRLAAALVLCVATLIASFGALVIASSEAEAQCRMINIGTPEKPRLVKDPACGSGR